MARIVSIIIPASNEARLLPNCLAALLDSEPPHLTVEVIVVSNGSQDGTADVARNFQAAMVAKSWDFVVLELPEGGKLGALNAADHIARGELRLYLDADVTVSRRLIAELARVLDRSEAAYASGRLVIRARGAVSRLYGRLWARVPYMTHGVPGCGLFAVNAAGRARWDHWPQIIADDMYARLHFAPWERHLIPEPYDWPIAEGLSALIRVRRRQDRGTAEIAERFPHLMTNEDKPAASRKGLAVLALRDPLGFAAYAGVSLAVRARRSDGVWSRGR